MRVLSLLIHGCAGVMLMLAMLTLLTDSYGQIPSCNGMVPGTTQACPDAKTVNCPNGGGVNQPKCVSSTCTILQQIPYKCVNGSNPNTLCQTGDGICAINYYCSWGVNKDGFYACQCNPSGTVVSRVHTLNLGSNISDCLAPGS